MCLNLQIVAYMFSAYKFSACKFSANKFSAYKFSAYMFPVQIAYKFSSILKWEFQQGDSSNEVIIIRPIRRSTLSNNLANYNFYIAYALFSYYPVAWFECIFKSELCNWFVYCILKKKIVVTCEFRNVVDWRASNFQRFCYLAKFAQIRCLRRFFALYVKT